MTEGHNHVRSIFERWRRLEDAKREIADDLKDLFSEAKSHGFDTKALRAAFRQVVKDEERSADDDEHDALVDTYMAAIQGHARPAHARVEIVEEIPPHDAETGELVEAADTGRLPAGYSDVVQGGASFNAGDDAQAAGPVSDAPGIDSCQSPEVPQAAAQGRNEPASVAPAAAPLEDPELPAFLDRRGRP